VVTPTPNPVVEFAEQPELLPQLDVDVIESLISSRPVYSMAIADTLIKNKHPVSANFMVLSPLMKKGYAAWRRLSGTPDKFLKNWS
jgi:hypothetical protein